MHDSTKKPLIELRGASYRIRGKEILFDITWTLMEGDNWVIRGANGAGKTTFLRLVRGDIWPARDVTSRMYYFNGRARTSPIGFREKTGFVSAELLDRYKESRWNLTGFDTVCTGFFGTAFLHQRPTEDQLDRAREVIEALAIEDLADQRMLTMSLGQAKKILLCRAIVHEPRVLVLDEALDGIDVDSRRRISAILEELTQNGTRLLIASHEAEDLIPAVNRWLVLESGRIADYGFIEQRNHQPESASRKSTDPGAGQPTEKTAANAEQPFVIRIEEADVSIRGRRILSAINWTIHPGENWALLGPNGSGKTTLLRLIAGDLHPMPGGRVLRFGDHSPQSLWEIRRRISLVSSDIQAEHQLDQTGMDTVLSGLFGSIGLYADTTREQRRSALAMMESFGLESLADRSITTLSYAQVRMLLILRAMMIQPQLLLLDEPTSGLDEQAELDVLELIEQLASSMTAIVHVTHRADKLSHSFNRFAYVDHGRLQV